jgi:hypothetical protein
MSFLARAFSTYNQRELLVGFECPINGLLRFYITAFFYFGGVMGSFLYSGEFG